MVALDGYLTAFHAGPELVLPSEWMPGIWGDDPVFDNQAEAQSIRMHPVKAAVGSLSPIGR